MIFQKFPTFLFLIIFCSLWFQEVITVQIQSTRKEKHLTHIEIELMSSVINYYSYWVFNIDVFAYICHLQNTQTQRQHTSLFIFVSFHFLYIFICGFTVSVLTNNQLQFLQHNSKTKVINSLLHLINGNAILTKASRLREFTSVLAVSLTSVIMKPTLSFFCGQSQQILMCFQTASKIIRDKSPLIALITFVLVIYCCKNNSFLKKKEWKPCNISYVPTRDNLDLDKAWTESLTQVSAPTPMSAFQSDNC